MSLTDDISQAAATPAYQDTPSRRLAGMSPNIDPAIQGMLAADQTQSDSQIQGFAHAATQLVTAVPGALMSSARTVFEDPVLYKQPTAALKVHQWLTQQAGWLPVAQIDLHQVQRNLQKQGFGKSLDVSGVWTPEWQSVFHQASQDHYEEARSSSSAGSGFSVGHLFHSFVNAVMPSHAIPALVGAIKAFPGEVRHAAADAAGMVTQFGSDVVHGNLLDATTFAFNPAASGVDYSVHGPRSDAAATVGAAVEGVSPDVYDDEHGWGRLIENANVALTLLPLIRLGTTVANAGGQAVARGLLTDMGKEQVTRGPGLISNMLYRPSGYYPTAAGVDYVAGDSGLLAAKAFDHLPYLRQMMPAVRQGVASGQRYWYYTARPFAAAPYRLPLFQALGHSFQHVTLTGAMYRGDAAALDHLIGDNDFSKSVQGEHPYTGPVGLALDIMSAAAHGPLNTRLPFAARTADEAAAARPATIPAIGIRPSESVGNLVGGAHGVYDTMLGKPGVIGAFERGIPGWKYDEALTAFRENGLDKADLDWTLQSKVDQFAAAHGAHSQLIEDTSRGVQREDTFRTLAAKIRGSDPEALRKARAELLDNDTALATRVANNYNDIIQGPKAAYGDMIAEAKARRVAYDLINDPNLAWQNIHGGTFTAIKDAKDEAAFAKAIDKTPPAPGVEPGLTAGWLRVGNPDAPYGSLGIARLDTKLRGHALKLISGFEKEYQRITTKGGELVQTQDTAALQALKTKMAELALELHVDPNSIPLDYDSLVNVLRERANALAEKVVEPLNPTVEYTAAREALRGHGYELVHGTGIGFEFTNPIIDPVLVDGGVRTVRKAAETLGLGSSYASTMDASQWHRIATVRAWQKLINDGKIAPQPGWTPSLLYRHAYDNRSLRLTGARGAVFKLAENRRWRRMAEHAVGADAPAEVVDAKLAEWERQAASERSLMDLADKEFVAAITARPRGGIPNNVSGELDAPVTEAEARLLQTAMIGAVAKRPKFIFGGAHLEDMLRAGGASFLGKRAANSRVLARAARSGNDYVRFRNTYRFGIDPMFSMRRIVKSYLKLRTVGVPTSHHLPWQAMIEQGTLEEDLKLADRLFPEVRGITEGMDALDRAVYHADLMGLFNPRHFYAYGAGWLKRMGMSDAQIKDQVERALTYGERTALERTLGTFFYPFSFEKTLWRQVGSRLLDEPGQRFMLLAAAQTFHALNENDQITDWADRHLPLLHELQKLNAFAHGLGPGIPGGINRPFADAMWNLLGPQHATPESDKGKWYDTITSLVPAINELNSLLVGYSPTTGAMYGGTLTSQAGITWQAAKNWTDDGVRAVFNDPRSPWNPQRPAETARAQQDDGYQMRNHLIVQWAAAINYNYHHRSAPITFPTDGSVPDWLAGKTVNKTSIDEVVHHWYPAFDPAKAQKIAVEKRVAMDRFITQMRAANPDRADAYQGFADNATRFNSWKAGAELDPANLPALAEWTGQFRAYAVSLSEQDPTFYKFYRQYFQSTFGPLEALTG